MKKLLADLLQTNDGRWSGAKMAAFTAHTLFAIVFAKVSLTLGFVPDMWLLYGGFAIGHAITNQVTASVKDFKEQRLNAENPPPPGTTTTFTKETTTDVRQPSPQGPPV